MITIKEEAVSDRPLPPDLVSKDSLLRKNNELAGPQFDAPSWVPTNYSTHEK